MENSLEILKFGEQWRGTTNFEVESTGNYFFSARVIYHSNKFGIQEENCTIHIYRNGYQDGSIEIYEYGSLTSETHHLSFKPEWQKYSYDDTNGTLAIIGNSKKMEGEYRVIIYPNGEKARIIKSR